jgi:formylglycine-generating enzyme required for sulfatase activity
MDRTEVTIGDYLRFHEATGHPLPEDWEDSGLSSLKDRPMVMVSWTDARAYAEWAGKRLPTLKEFQRAVGGTVGNELPWTRYRADVPSESLAVLAVVRRRGDIARSDVDETIFAREVPPVGSHPTDCSEDGVFDLLGSVREWLDASWRRYDADAQQFEVNSDLKIAISAAWTDDLRHANPQLMLPVMRDLPASLAVGFRCVRSVDPLATLRPLDDDTSR